MPKIPRGQQAGFVYHVINRGNGRATVFHKAQDYQAFLSILALAKARHPVKIFAFSLQLRQKIELGALDSTVPFRDVPFNRSRHKFRLLPKKSCSSLT